MRSTSLLPNPDAIKRSGCIYTADEAAALWAKRMTDDSGDDPKSFLLVKLYTVEAQHWTLYAIDLNNHSVIATGVATTEKVAFDHLKRELAQRGFDVT